MNVLSVCSGIEAASVAWKPLGWNFIGFAEIDKFPSAVLAHHYPEVRNYGDFTKIELKDLPCHPDVLVGGTPCQSFSVAGKRAGLDDPRGNLTLEFVRLAARLRTRWLVWENVPGVLSIDGGRTFGAFLKALGEVGYGFAYRILDAQYFGVPQRRRRVFLVGYLGDWRCAAAVLFEPESLRGNPPPSREKRESAPTIPSRRSGGGGLGTDFDCDGGLVESRIPSFVREREISHPLTCHQVKMGDPTTDNYVVTGGFFDQATHSLRADGFDASEDGTGRGTPLVPWMRQGMRIQNPEGVGDTVTHNPAGGTRINPVLAPISFMPARTFGKDGGIDSRYAPRDVCDALHTASGGGNKAPLILQRERVGTSCCLDCLIEFDVHYLPGTEMLEPFVCPQCGDAPGFMTYDVQHGGTAPISFSCKDSGLDAGSTAPTLCSMNFSGSHANAGGQIAIAIQERAVCENPLAGPYGVGVRSDGLAYTVEARQVPQAVAFNLRGRDGGSQPELTDQASLRSASGGSSRTYVAPAMAVRRLTPTECERLQDFPDDYTKIDDKTADGPRYKALGNSMAVCCMAWIGRRIRLIDFLFS